MSPIILIILIVVVLAGGVYALNHFKVIRLWGKKAPVVTETLPEPETPLTGQTPSTTDQGAQPATTTGKESLTTPGEGIAAKSTSASSTKKEPSSMKAAASSAPAGSGRYTVQFAAWMSKLKADQQASLLTGAGYDAFVEESHAGGDHWYQVRVGRYDSRTQAQEIVTKLQPMTEDVVWVATLRNK